MRRLWRENGLSLVTFGLFVLFWICMAISGFYDYNAQQRDFGQPLISFWAYFATGHFWEATMENWESEFLQMGLFVLLTAYLFQRGSAEAKNPDEKTSEKEEEHKEEARRSDKNVPWPIRKGGVIEKVYDNSLSIALLLLFVLTFLFHAIAGAKEYNHEQALMGNPTVTTLQFLATPDFWFQSFQNWQSEFLAVGAMVVLTIYLRQKGSPESKRVGAPARATGQE